MAWCGVCDHTTLWAHVAVRCVITSITWGALDRGLTQRLESSLTVQCDMVLYNVQARCHAVMLMVLYCSLCIVEPSHYQNVAIQFKLIVIMRKQTLLFTYVLANIVLAFHQSF